jgi:CoA transferase family III
VEQRLTEELWKDLGGAAQLLERVVFSGRSEGLPSPFRVDALASATIAVAALAVAELWSGRTGEPLRAVRVDRRLAAAAFRCERLLKPQGWTLPERFDPIIGDYAAQDGWIRLHTNYRHHRDAAVRVLGVAAERKAVADAVARCGAVELESAIVAAGGCAAALRTRDEWRRHPQGSALAAEPLVAWEGRCSPRAIPASPQAPLAGIRVLDLTRVIAGPVGSRYLAAHGAQVLRIDPPALEEMTGLLPETTLGKRCAALDLGTAADRQTFERLVSEADLLMHGYRPGALEALGYSDERLRSLNPAAAIVCHNAYGWSGPWARRRGFDSLVQMSSGIAHPGNEGAPTPLPAQALDHGTGYLLAAAACRALTEGRARSGLSLARTARLLVDLGENAAAAPELGDAGELFERNETAWGPVLQVRCAGTIEGYRPRWAFPAGPTGRHEARWQ